MTENEKRDSSGPDLWPFHPRTNIIDRDTARSIRAWALTDGEMTEAADSDEVAQAFRNDVALRYEMKPPSVPT